MRATPLVRRLAQELGVDLATVAGTGPQGRITEEDVRGGAHGSVPAHRTGEGDASRSAASSGRCSSTSRARTARSLRSPGSRSATSRDVDLKQLLPLVAPGRRRSRCASSRS